jgi:outer membrane protein OmpA-like peptidoglycan-associated protein
MRRVIYLLVALSGCASAPKPPELETFERIRSMREVSAAQKRSPQLCGESDQLYSKSTEEWKSKDLDDSRRDALMGSIKLKTAIALAEQDTAKVRTSAADKELAKSEEEYGRLAKELTALNEAIALMQKLQESRQSAATDKAKLSQQLSEQQAQATARDKMAAAELAVKTADIVDAATNAKAEYASAKDLLERARAEMKQSNWQAAATSADLAKSKADAAAAAAKPLYDKTQQATGDRTRDEALGRDAAAISGVTVRLERRGEMQRLVLPLRGLFFKKSTALAVGNEALLDQVAALAKKYPTYPILVVGHTSKGGRAAELVALSISRAQQVASALTSRGVEDRRLKVTGQGADEPIADSRGASKALNDRIEVIFIYQ